MILGMIKLTFSYTCKTKVAVFVENLYGSLFDFSKLNWRARHESNVRPSASEADALSN